jgi:lipoprotein-anchoring transpeptidase ErfK/SrfK
LETLISSGKPWTPTVTGEFRIWSKFQYAKMSGGSKERGNYYYLPNVPYIMYFYKDFSLHGTYWHNNFGHPMSHGCVNLPTPIAEKLYYWTAPTVPMGKHYVSAGPDNQGTRIVVHN